MKKMKNEKIQITIEKASIVEFVQKTKNGVYAPINNESLPYARVETETQSLDDLYVYGVK